MLIRRLTKNVGITYLSENIKLIDPNLWFFQLPVMALHSQITIWWIHLKKPPPTNDLVCTIQMQIDAKWFNLTNTHK